MDWCLGCDEYWWQSLTVLPAPVEDPETQYLLVVVELPSPRKIMHSTPILRDLYQLNSIISIIDA